MGNGGLTLSVMSTVEEWLAFNASVQRAVERQGRLSLAPRGGLERGGVELPARGGSLPSSEAEMIRPLEGRFSTLERGGDAGRSRGSRWEPSSEAEMPRGSEGGENGLHAGLL